MHFGASCLVAALVFCAGPACSPAPQLGQPHISLRSTGTVAVLVTGLAEDDLASLRAWPPNAGAWAPLLRVSVASGDGVAIAGRYRVAGTDLEFSPQFPFDAGRQYFVQFDPSRLPTPRGRTLERAVVALPGVDHKPSVVVSAIYPSAPVWPENQLRLYIQFSAPMSRRSGVDFVKLVDDAGHEVKHTFLALEADFWNTEHTRYTVFFDPGRVKRGILPNEQMGRALVPGRRYTIVVDAAWPDANGQPLAAGFRREFRVGPADTRPITVADWRLAPPAAGSRDPLVVTFPESLDHGLLHRALGVAAPDGRAMAGEMHVEANETRWLFVPQQAWTPGAHQLVVLTMLEDMAGNKVGRAFEVDRFDRVDSAAAPERVTVPFTVTRRALSETSMSGAPHRPSASTATLNVLLGR